MKFTIEQVRTCELCKRWLAEHTSFPASLAEETYRYPSGPWKHRTPLAKRIHELAERIEGRINDAPDNPKIRW